MSSIYLQESLSLIGYLKCDMIGAAFKHTPRICFKIFVSKLENNLHIALCKEN